MQHVNRELKKKKPGHTDGRGSYLRGYQKAIERKISELIGMFYESCYQSDDGALLTAFKGFESSKKVFMPGKLSPAEC